ncbi:MAG: rRNA pseudouridine synthase, partial [Chitinophagaceae bacterium]
MTSPKHRYFIIHKPYNMVSQFISPDKVRLLGDLDFDFPEGTHAIGRLDNHSEGLLILTTNKRVTKLLFENAGQKHKRTYLVQVRHVMTEETLEQLREGVNIEVGANEMYFAKPEEVAFAQQPPDYTELQEHYYPVPHSWVSITLTEGKFHQVRKMVKAVRHPCKRLFRISIEDIELGDLKAGAVK